VALRVARHDTIKHGHTRATRLKQHDRKGTLDVNGRLNLEWDACVDGATRAVLVSKVRRSHRPARFREAAVLLALAVTDPTAHLRVDRTLETALISLNEIDLGAQAPMQTRLVRRDHVAVAALGGKPRVLHRDKVDVSNAAARYVAQVDGKAQRVVAQVEPNPTMARPFGLSVVGAQIYSRLALNAQRAILEHSRPGVPVVVHDPACVRQARHIRHRAQSRAARNWSHGW
jgi:hypothetical protein